jgi:SNF family Na+-dependent transporter
MHTTVAYNMGFIFTVVVCLDMCAVALWTVGRKEHVRRYRKRHKGQRWWAYRIWLISSAIKVGLFYVAIAGWLHNGTL